MNALAMFYLEAVAVIVLGSLLFALVVKGELVRRVREAVAWLLKVSFVDFVKMVIFIRPWKPYAWQTSVIAWLILAYFTGRYLIVSQPKLSDIAGPYIPMIGYVYYLSLLFLVSFVLYAVAKVAHKD